MCCGVVVLVCRWVGFVVVNWFDILWGVFVLCGCLVFDRCGINVVW